jgi:2-dehydro-3-deoxyphosphogluconate aldolase/(4S)-4-hydroxy-2-oxoglutarate aldolase
LGELAKNNINRSVVDQLIESKIIVILRGVPEKKVVPLVGKLIENGITAIEVTMNSEGALRQIGLLADRYGDQILLGAGTVTEYRQAMESIRAGATYLITPYVSEEVAEVALPQAIPVLMGAMTPTEIARAGQLGAELIKVFPAGRLGAGYIKDILGPMNDAKLVAVGGITPENAQTYINAGAVAIGVGSSLVDEKRLTEPDWEKSISERARLFVKALK